MMMMPIKLAQVVAGIVLFVVVGVLAVHLQVCVVQLGYDVHAAEKQRRELEEENRQLRAKIAAKRNLKSLADAARRHELPIAPPEDRKKWDTLGPTRTPISPSSSPRR